MSSRYTGPLATLTITRVERFGELRRWATYYQIVGSDRLVHTEWHTSDNGSGLWENGTRVVAEADSRYSSRAKTTAMLRRFPIKDPTHEKAGPPARDQDARDVPTGRPMGGAELVVALQWLGLDQRSFARILDVDERTVRRWVADRSPVPDTVRARIAQIHQETDQAVARVVVALRDTPDPGALVYRNTPNLWSQRPEVEPFPAGWWRMVCARANHQVPDARLAWTETTLE